MPLQTYPLQKPAFKRFESMKKMEIMDMHQECEFTYEIYASEEAS
jgi:hypothetical protein